MKVKLNLSLKNLDGSDIGSSKKAFVVNEQNQFIVDEEGVPVEATIVDQKNALTIKSICKTLLFFDVVGEKTVDDYKTKKFDLGMKIIAQSEEVDLQVQEIGLLQELAKLKYAAPLVAIQFCKLLEGIVSSFNEEEDKKVKNIKKV